MKQLPYSRDTERGIISAAFVDPDYVFTEAELDPGVFMDRDHASIWKAMLTLWRGRMNVTALTVENELERQGVTHLNAGDLTEFVVSYETPYSAGAMAKKLKDLARRRDLVQAATEVVKQAYDERVPVTDIVARLETSVEGTVDNQDLVDGGMLMDFIIEGMNDPSDGGRERIFTGIGGIDSTFLGLEDGRVWIGAAVPNTGKSMFTMAIARGVLSQNVPCGVLYIHPEQGEVELSNVMLSSGTKNIRPVRVKLAQLTDARRNEYARMLVNKNPITAKQIFGEGFRLSDFTRAITSEEQQQIIGSRSAIKWPIRYMDPKAYNIFVIRQKIRAMRSWLTRNHGEDAFLLVVVDGLHLLSGAGESSRVQELTTITRELKISAGNDVTPGAIIANHQLNYSFYNGDMTVASNRHYTLRGLRDSGSIGQDADVVYFLDRQTVFNQDRDTVVAPTREWDDFTMFVKKNRQTSSLFHSKYQINTRTMAIRDKEEQWQRAS